MTSEQKALLAGHKQLSISHNHHHHEEFATTKDSISRKMSLKRTCNFTFCIVIGISSHMASAQNQIPIKGGMKTKSNDLIQKSGLRVFFLWTAETLFGEFQLIKSVSSSEVHMANQEPCSSVSPQTSSFQVTRKACGHWSHSAYSIRMDVLTLLYI